MAEASGATALLPGTQIRVQPHGWLSAGRSRPAMTGRPRDAHDAAPSFVVAARSSRLFIQSRADMRISRPACRAKSSGQTRKWILPHSRSGYVSQAAGVQMRVAGTEREMLADMTTGLDPKELIELALLLIATGALSGFLAGVFGIGGGAILVPVFYECFRLAGVPLEVRMPLCIGTSLAIIIPTSLASFRAHYARGAVDMAILRRWWLPVLIGVAVGSVTARFAPERLFKIVFVVVAWSAAARLLLARDTWKLGDDVPKGFLMRVYGFFIGLLSTLMGVGGGLFANLVMTFYGRPIHQAVATSSALAILISIPGALGYVYAGWPAAARFPDVTALQVPFAFGYVSLIGALLAMPTTLVTAPIGVKVAHALSKRTLEMAFGAYMFIVGGRFAISLLSGQ
jgi:uncharacterized membrane protein YfcA